MKNNHLNKLLLSVIIFLNSGNILADYFAYVPDVASKTESKYLHVVNTDFNILVESVILFGTPREVIVSHKGDYVFVSTELSGEDFSESKINVIHTGTNKLIVPIALTTNSAWGMALSQDDSLLYVTHRAGITRITEPTFLLIRDTLDLTYAGVTVALSDDEKYLFVIGLNQSGTDYGISVVDVSTEEMKPVTDFSLGAGVGTFDIIFKNEESLYVLNRTTAELIRVQILNYNSAADLALFSESVIALPQSSYPTDMALNKDRSELFVTLSFVNNSNDGTGEGYILAYKTLDLSIFDTISLSQEGGKFTEQGGALHPRSISFDDEGKLHVVKQLWSDVAGTYVTSIDDTTNRRSGIRKFTETSATILGERSGSLTNGKFVGPDCSYCPTGVTDSNDKRISASAINPFVVLFVALIICFFRVKFYRNEINHSRSRWRYLPRQ